MLIAPTAAKHNLPAPAPSLKSSKSKKKQQQQRAAAALISSGFQHFNHQQQEKLQRQHHNSKDQQEKSQQQQQAASSAASSTEVKLKQQQHQTAQDNNNHVHNSNHLIENQQQVQPQQQQQHEIDKQQQQQRAMEAMKKLDAKLVAYLTGENLTQTSTTTYVDNDVMESKELSFKKMNLCSSNSSSSLTQELRPNVEASRELLYEMFSRMNGIKLQMEALTLQPEGTKRMELLQNDIRPIFTIECQLSHELIKSVPRYDMFHIMQFESEKFQSLTQCTRFGQEAERAVKLEVINNNNNANTDNGDIVNNNNIVYDLPNFGRIHFTVWWREPGTCLNEMLGMGVLALDELYTASVLEQCKRIVIQRRNIHLANLYLKISVQVDKNAMNINEEEETINNNMANNNQQQQQIVNNDADNNSNISSSVDSPIISDTAQRSTELRHNTDTDDKKDDEKNVQIETTNFMAETSRVRLLRGFIYAGEVRQLNLNVNDDYLICRRFWEDELAVTTAVTHDKFDYQEQFSVINDDAFLRRVDRQDLQLELWRCKPAADGNGNENEAVQPYGILSLPLHQFFIAYRDVTITNHLCKVKLPVISFDAWAPIMSCNEANKRIGELRCMLAIGSDEQINELKTSHDFSIDIVREEATGIKKTLFLQTPKIPLAIITHSAAAASSSSAQVNFKKSTAGLLDLLQLSLNKKQYPSDATSPAQLGTSVCSNVPSSLLKPLQASNVKSFRFLLEIERANGLPRNPAPRGKKKRNNNSKHQRFPPNEAPSTYVTFQADEGLGPIYKSHEGAVYATAIVDKCTQPRWHEPFIIATSVDYLLNPQKRFILKIWKKAATDSPHKRQQPTPLEDAIIGFVALDLNVFMRGLHIAGCFNIVNFNGRINGQLEIRAQPLENLPKLPSRGREIEIATAAGTATSNTIAQNVNSNNVNVNENTTTGIDNFIDEFENTLDLAHLNLGQAIKRKFAELECISQRLRTRLNDVTGEQLSSVFNETVLDNWHASQIDDSSNNLDDDFDEFEHDINTAPPATDKNQIEKDSTHIENASKE